MFKAVRIPAVLIASVITFAACSSDEKSAEPTTTEAPVVQATTTTAAPVADKKDIVDTAVAAGTFKTLATALTEADLVDTLKGEGPFTVFAPTDDAFAALPEGALDGLLAKPDDLKNVLLYHVVSGSAVKAADVVGLTEAEMANGEKITIKVVDGSVIINDSVKVVTTDIEASNGVIHVVDAVILPKA